MQPCLQFGQAVVEGREVGRGDGFSGDVELNVVGVAVKTETMTTNDGTKGE